jgi:hypothetical protein
LHLHSLDNLGVEAGVRDDRSRSNGDRHPEPGGTATRQITPESMNAENCNGKSEYEEDAEAG